MSNSTLITAFPVDSPPPCSVRICLHSLTSFPALRLRWGVSTLVQRKQWTNLTGCHTCTRALICIAAPAVVMWLWVCTTHLLTSNAQQVCALLRGQLSYEWAAFVGTIFLFYPLEILWHLLTHWSCPPEGLRHLLLKITMLGKVNARFFMYSEFY